MEPTRPAWCGSRPRGPLINPAQPHSVYEMNVNLRMLRRIDQVEEVEAADGAISGGRQIHCAMPFIAYPRA